jgi:ribosomal protein S18 acetylase RimI-like enzyme
MPSTYKDLYKVKKKDIPGAGAVLADAFSTDPVWRKVLDDTTDEQRNIFFESAVKYSLTYGEVLATSKELEGILVWTPDHLADMNMWRWLRSGSIFKGIRGGIGLTMLSFKLKPIFDPLVADRKSNMEGRSYYYATILGVARKYQGQGHARKLINGMIEKGDEEKKPIYLETSTEKNVKMYERYGFEVLKKITLPVIDLPQWEMWRVPNS